MATGDFIEFEVRDGSGNPKTDALSNGLAFIDYRNRAGTSRTPPTITQLLKASVPTGVYRFQPTTADVAEGIAYVITTGSGASPAYYAGALHSDALPFAALLLIDSATGGLWAGAAPTVDFYVDPSSNARTPPSVNMVRTYLATMSPSAADLLVGAAGRLAPASGCDAISPFSFAVSTNVDPATASSPEPSGLFQQQITYAAITARDTAGRPTLGAPATSRARVQSCRTFVRDQAGESVQAAFKVYLPPSAAITYQHRIWLTSEGDDAGVQSQARRIISIDKLRDGVATERFRVVYV